MKILGSDFDNTLFFSEDKQTTMKNIEAIKKFIANKNIFCIITGRTYMEIEEELERINLPYTYMVCGDGAQIFDSNGNCLETLGLSREIAEKYLKILREEGYEPYLEDGYTITTDINNCIKISAEFVDKEKALNIIEKINKELDVYAYASTIHININNPKNNKKQAILRLAEKTNLSPANFHVIGDDVNDYEMLKDFNGVVVKNHNPKLDELNLPVYENLYNYIDYLLDE